MKWIVKALACFVWLAAVPLPAAEVKISFLEDESVLADTQRLLMRAGCSSEATNILRQTVSNYFASGFVLDRTRFPEKHDGVHRFPDMKALVQALPHVLWNTQHAYEWNCFDTVISLTTPALRTTLPPDQMAGLFLAPSMPATNSFSIRPVATARDAVSVTYPDWYRQAASGQWSGVGSDQWIGITAALFQSSVLPFSTEDHAVSRKTHEALLASWRRSGLAFPTNVQVVLCHQVSLANRFLVTAHAALLIRDGERMSYLSKEGGSGPFVRIDFSDERDLKVWLTAMFKGAGSLGYTHHFVTWNDSRIEELPVEL